MKKEKRHCWMLDEGRRAEILHLLRWHFDQTNKTNHSFISLGKSKSTRLKIYCFWKHFRFDMWSTASCMKTLQQKCFSVFVNVIYTVDEPYRHALHSAKHILVLMTSVSSNYDSASLNYETMI